MVLGIFLDTLPGLGFSCCPCFCKTCSIEKFQTVLYVKSFLSGGSYRKTFILATFFDSLLIRSMGPVILITFLHWRTNKNQTIFLQRFLMFLAVQDLDTVTFLSYPKSRYEGQRWLALGQIMADTVVSGPIWTYLVPSVNSTFSWTIVYNDQLEASRKKLISLDASLTEGLCMPFWFHILPGRYEFKPPYRDPNSKLYK